MKFIIHLSDDSGLRYPKFGPFSKKVAQKNAALFRKIGYDAEIRPA